MSNTDLAHLMLLIGAMHDVTEKILPLHPAKAHLEDIVVKMEKLIVKSLNIDSCN